MSGTMPTFRSPRARQHGVATLLILLLVGLAVVVTALAVAYSLRSNQQRQLATHSVTTAQASAWRGVEFVRDVLNGMADSDGGQQVLYGLSWGSSPDEGCIPASGSGGCSGAMDEFPAWDSASEWTEGTQALSGEVDLDVDASLGFGAAITSVTRLADYHSYQVTAKVTGQAAGSAIEPLATSTVEVVYEIRPSSGTEEHWSCPAPKGAMVFNGDLTYSGGKLDVQNPEREYENVVVAGKLTIGGGSTAKISGCIKGDVDISGGGVTDNGHIHSEGTIKINGMSNPAGATLWGRNVQIGSGVSGGSYTAMKAGAYTATVYSGGTAIGTTNVGGKLIASSVAGGIPWVIGTVVPDADNGRIVITSGGNQFLLDLGSVSIDPATGVVSGAAAAAELLAGDSGATLADALVFKTTAIYGGGISLSTLTVNKLWGYGVTISGWAGSYGTLWASGNIEIVTGTIGDLVGGGDMNASSAGLYWSFPTISNSGRLAGKLTYGSGKAAVPSPTTAIAKLQVNQANTSPGLPGVPWCDARVEAVNADDFKGLANYVFEIVDGNPILTIKNVNKADGTSIAGTYALNALAAGQADVLNTIFKCSTGSGQGTICLNGNASGWTLDHLIWVAPGVMWFDRAVTIASERHDALVATIVSKSNVTLTDMGGGTLTAPNFSTVERVCRGPVYPTTLCEKRNGVMEFVTWEDADGNSYKGLPIASSSVIAQGGFAASGWTLYGNVLLGGGLLGGNGGAVVTIHGTLTVGSNATSASTVSAGGMAVIVPAKSEGHNVSPICDKVEGVIGRPVSVRWSRYL